MAQNVLEVTKFKFESGPEWQNFARFGHTVRLSQDRQTWCSAELIELSYLLQKVVLKLCNKNSIRKLAVFSLEEDFETLCWIP